MYFYYDCVIGIICYWLVVFSIIGYILGCIIGLLVVFQVEYLDYYLGINVWMSFRLMLNWYYFNSIGFIIGILVVYLMVVELFGYQYDNIRPVN